MRFVSGNDNNIIQHNSGTVFYPHVNLLTYQKIKEIMLSTENLSLKRTAVRCLGTLSKYSSDHCKAVEEFCVLEKLLEMSLHFRPSKENLQRLLKIKTSTQASIRNKKTIRSSVNKNKMEEDLAESLSNLKSECQTAILEMIRNSINSDSLLKYLAHSEKNKNSLLMCLKQVTKCLNSDSQAKKKFAKKGGLRYVMQIKHETETIDSSVRKAAEEILQVYPKELVRLYTPGYPQLLLKKLDDYQIPQ